MKVGNKVINKPPTLLQRQTTLLPTPLLPSKHQLSCLTRVLLTPALLLNQAPPPPPPPPGPPPSLPTFTRPVIRDTDLRPVRTCQARPVYDSPAAQTPAAECPRENADVPVSASSLHPHNHISLRPKLQRSARRRRARCRALILSRETDAGGISPGLRVRHDCGG